VRTVFTFSTRNKSGITGGRHVCDRSHICCKGLSETYLQGTRILIYVKWRKFDAVVSYHGRIILIWIFRKWDVGIWTGSSWLRIGTGGG